jgi:hypothetical protein
VNDSKLSFRGIPGTGSMRMGMVISRVESLLSYNASRFLIPWSSCVFRPFPLSPRMCRIGVGGPSLFVGVVGLPSFSFGSEKLTLGRITDVGVVGGVGLFGGTEIGLTSVGEMRRVGDVVDVGDVADVVDVVGVVGVVDVVEVASVGEVVDVVAVSGILTTTFIGLLLDLTRAGSVLLRPRVFPSPSCRTEDSDFPRCSSLAS